MRGAWCGVVLCVIVCAPVARANKDKAAENAFRDSVIKQQLVLRSFSGEDVVHAVWAGTALEVDQPRWRTIGVLDVNSVQMKHHELILLCTRRVLMRDASGKFALSDGERSVEIDVDLKGADPVQVLPQLKQQLFYSSTDEAVAAVPKRLQGMLPAREPGSGPRRAGGVMCDCAEEGTDACSGRNPREGLRPPRATYTPDPEYSEEARNAGINGDVLVALVVDETGRATDLWVARPAGYGLDETSVNAVRQYEFQPATCHGQPIAMPLNVEVNFHIFSRRR
ncbi:MAG TPA: energy transducer TonB [Acidobacteriaceae bacterium]|nr:energy transducer TonB [Acidobacteriaceae bacterium]